MQENGIEVKIADSDITTFIKRSDLSRDRSEQRPERFNVGDKVDAAITNLDKNSRRITVSIKALEIAEEKQAVAQYGSSDSGASLGRHLQGRHQEEGKRRRQEGRRQPARVQALQAWIKFGALAGETPIADAAPRLPGENAGPSRLRAWRRPGVASTGPWAFGF